MGVKTTMSETRKLTGLTLTRGHYQVVGFSGEIMRDDRPWEVRYTFSRDGYIDTSYEEAFGDLGQAHERIGELVSRESANV